MSDNRTAEQMKAAKIYAASILGYKWKNVRDDDTIVAGYLQGHKDASQQTASLREENERLEQENIGLKYKITLYEEADDEWNKIVRRKKDNIKQLQEEVERVKGDVKRIAVDFFYWWHNQPGTNTEQGFDKYIETERFKALSSKESKTS